MEASHIEKGYQYELDFDIAEQDYTFSDSYAFPCNYSEGIGITYPDRPIDCNATIEQNGELKYY